MKPLLLIIIFLGVCCSCSREPTQMQLEELAKIVDPSTLTLKSGYTGYMDTIRLQDQTEVGVIRFGDHDSTKYWFRSHHITDDEGGTLFEFSDNKHRFFEGYFCCEVQLPDQQFKSRNDFERFLDSLKTAEQGAAANP